MSRGALLIFMLATGISQDYSRQTSMYSQIAVRIKLPGIAPICSLVDSSSIKEDFSPLSLSLLLRNEHFCLNWGEDIRIVAWTMTVISSVVLKNPC